MKRWRLWNRPSKLRTTSLTRIEAIKFPENNSRWPEVQWLISFVTSDAVRALAVYDHALRHMAEISNTQTRDVWLLAGSSYALRHLGRPIEAQQRLDAAFLRLKQLKLYPAEKTWFEADRALHALADHAEADTGNVARAIEIDEGLLNRLEAGGAKPESMLSDAVSESQIFVSLASLYRRAGHSGLASAIEARRLELWRHWDRRLPNNPLVLRQVAAKPGN